MNIFMNSLPPKLDFRISNFFFSIFALSHE